MDNQKRIILCISRLLGMKEQDIKADASLECGLGMDSLDKIELVMALEEEFEVVLVDEDVERCKTVADVAALIERETAK